MSNENLRLARQVKNDEFYTQLSDVEKELKHYKEHFKDRIVFCNCDNPEWSAFWKYFHLNFNHLGLKKLISTHYVKEVNAENTLFNINPDAFSYKMEYVGENDEDISVGVKTKLKGNGDFRSSECVELLKECDIVVTNPPFSMFREYVAQLMEYEKKFLILGNQNAVTHKDIFPLIRDNKLWYGYSVRSGGLDFRIPDDYEEYGKNVFIRDGHHFIFLPGIRWFTNLAHSLRHEKLILYKTYNPEEYPTYDNYNAINVDKTSDIPSDYEGVMGVPITFLDKYNPEQFEIIELGNGRDNFTPTKDYINPKMYKNGIESNGNAINRVLVYTIDSIPSKGVYYKADNCDKLLFAPYARVCIRCK